MPYGTSNDLIRIVENFFNKSVSPLQRVTMNHWLSFSLILDEEIPKSVEYLDKILGPLTYLVGESLSASDLAVFSVLYGKYNEFYYDIIVQQSVIFKLHNNYNINIIIFSYININIYIFSASNKFKEISKTKSFNNISRWMKLAQAQEPVTKLLKALPADIVENISKPSSRYLVLIVFYKMLVYKINLRLL